MPSLRSLAGPTDHVPPGENNRVLNVCMTVPWAVGPSYILSVTSPSTSSVCPLKEGACLLLTLPLSGLVIVTMGGAAVAVPTGPTAMTTSETAATPKSPLPTLLIGSCFTCMRRSFCRPAAPLTLAMSASAFRPFHQIAS